MVQVWLWNDTVSEGPTLTDNLDSIENITGSPYNDDLMGNSSDNVIKGLSGADALDGEGGTDTSNGGVGTDYCNANTEPPDGSCDIRILCELDT